MEPNSGNLVVVFPITSSAFGLPQDWFDTFSSKLIRPSFLLTVLLIVIAIGMLALKRFEHADFERKLWNIPVILTIVVFWPSLVIGLKTLVDTFNTFLARDVLGITWRGFGFPEFDSISNFAMWPAASLARLLPNLAYWVIYAFYIVFFFFYAVLGPFLLAKGILADEMENFFAVVQEMVLLLLWQTTLILVVAFVMPSIVNGAPLPARPNSNLYFMSFVLAILIFFTPALTRKFGAHLESAFVPLGFRWGGAMVGLAAASRLSGPVFSHLGVGTETVERLKPAARQALKLEEFKRRYETRSKIRDEHEELRELAKKIHEYDDEEREAWRRMSKVHEDKESEESAEKMESFLHLSKKAKREMSNEDESKK